MFKYVFTQPLLYGQDARLIFKWTWDDLNSEFSFSCIGCLTKAKMSSLPCNLSITGGKQMDSCLFQLAQTASSRIWTQATNYISTTITITLSTSLIIK